MLPLSQTGTSEMSAAPVSREGRERAVIRSRSPLATLAVGVYRTNFVDGFNVQGHRQVVESLPTGLGAPSLVLFGRYRLLAKVWSRA